jgi:hypothetical protein
MSRYKKRIIIYYFVYRGEMMKKGQGISINTIVIAAVAVLVLIVLAAILISQSGAFSKTLQQCDEIGGRCARTGTCVNRDDGYNRVHPTAACYQDGEKTEDDCCVPGITNEVDE